MLRNVLIALALVVAAGLGLWWYQAEQEEKLARALATNSAAALELSFARARALKVYDAKGTLLAKNTDVNALGLQVTQTTKAPFTIDYFVDLSGVQRGSFRWHAESRTMFVDLPDVTVGRPNIDQSRAQVAQSGVWVSREAGQRLQRAAAGALANGATREASKPEHLEAARRSAAERCASAKKAGAPRTRNAGAKSA